ncbi:MAG: hypothetical protein RIA63_12800, partial [Cyclobacteriaceae bacterium]
MKKIELTLVAGMFLGFVARDTIGLLEAEHTIMICGTFLGLFYLFTGWWTLKPERKNIKTVIISILFGLASGSLAFTLLFKILYLEGSDEMTMIGFILLLLAIVVDFVTSISGSKLINKWMTFRTGILASIALIFFLVPKDLRISTTYRKHPEFLRYYNQNKDRLPFYLLK